MPLEKLLKPSLFFPLQLFVFRLQDIDWSAKNRILVHACRPEEIDTLLLDTVIYIPRSIQQKDDREKRTLLVVSVALVSGDVVGTQEQFCWISRSRPINSRHEYQFISTHLYPFWYAFTGNNQQRTLVDKHSSWQGWKQRTRWWRIDRLLNFAILKYQRAFMGRVLSSLWPFKNAQEFK